MAGRKTSPEFAQLTSPETDRFHAQLWQYVNMLEAELCLSQGELEGLILSGSASSENELLAYNDLKAFIVHRGYPIEEFDASSPLGQLHIKANRDGVARHNGEILVRADLNIQDKIGVLLHEYAHQILHVGRDLPPPLLAHLGQYECEAEGISYVISAFLGIHQPTSALRLTSLEGSDFARRVLHTQANEIVHTSAEIIGDLYGAGGQTSAEIGLAFVHPSLWLPDWPEE